MEEETMTYELLFEALMREKNREELQRLDPEFYGHARAFIEEERRQALADPHAHAALQRVRNLESMLREIYARRERKILTLAMVKVKTGRDVFDVSVMLEAEKTLFDSLVRVLEDARKEQLEHAPIHKPVQSEDTEDADFAHVRFRRQVGAFIGEELESYGPYNTGDRARIPRSIAKSLVERGDASFE